MRPTFFSVFLTMVCALMSVSARPIEARVQHTIPEHLPADLLWKGSPLPTACLLQNMLGAWPPEGEVNLTACQNAMQDYKITYIGDQNAHVVQVGDRKASPGKASSNTSSDYRGGFSGSWRYVGDTKAGPIISFFYQPFGGSMQLGGVMRVVRKGDTIHRHVLMSGDRANGAVFNAQLSKDKKTLTYDSSLTPAGAMALWKQHASEENQKQLKGINLDALPDCAVCYFSWGIYEAHVGDSFKKQTLVGIKTRAYANVVPHGNSFFEILAHTFSQQFKEGTILSIEKFVDTVNQAIQKFHNQ